MNMLGLFTLMSHQFINNAFFGSVKVVENPVITVQSIDGAAQSAIQYFENMRNFLVAVRSMKLLTFEASDLEKVCFIGTELNVKEPKMNQLYNRIVFDWHLSTGWIISQGR